MNTEPTADYAEVLGDLVDALHDELAHEVYYSPHVREHVERGIELLGGNYESYRSQWWLGGED